MADDQVAVPADADVHLQGRHAQRQGPGEAGEGVLRHQAPGAAVALQVESIRSETTHEQPENRCGRT